MRLQIKRRYKLVVHVNNQINKNIWHYGRISYCRKRSYPRQYEKVLKKLSFPGHLLVCLEQVKRT